MCSVAMAIAGIISALLFTNKSPYYRVRNWSKGVPLNGNPNHRVVRLGIGKLVGTTYSCGEFGSKTTYRGLCYVECVDPMGDTFTRRGMTLTIISDNRTATSVVLR